jgi:hypothetical protein
METETKRQTRKVCCGVCKKTRSVFTHLWCTSLKVAETWNLVSAADLEVRHQCFHVISGSFNSFSQCFLCSIESALSRSINKQQTNPSWRRSGPMRHKMLMSIIITIPLALSNSSSYHATYNYISILLHHKPNHLTFWKLFSRFLKRTHRNKSTKSEPYPTRRKHWCKPRSQPSESGFLFLRSNFLKHGNRPKFSHRITSRVYCFMITSP